ncbi:FAD-dependent oxidoreductase [Janibacter sp. Soil728]|uniref:phytoene desaturase family protein n=1 Tax=Janibacter sp. Soil728 TaxID=1736393 RepID=UPI0006F387E6|nr:NAD(P)/FAD-dependent oxidoreductase [Janibacter sp. Soil728]KRE35366.1 FAD-dependent oxidoreductase [Janibacter sp. Soil728]
MESVDAVIIGAGHHGLVTAAYLADAGWDVLVVEERDRVGGAVASRSSEGWIEDEFSACHPLAMASPVLRELDLEAHGLQWAQAERPLAHVAGPGEGGVALHADAEATAAGLDREHPGDGREWLRMVEQWGRVRDPLLAALLTRWPPIKDAARVLARLGLREAPDLARLAVLPVTQLAAESFGGRGAGQLLAGNAMHADIPPTSAGSGLYGWLMTMLCQEVGFPSPKGGTRELAEALRRRAESAGARVETGAAVERIVVASGRVHGVELADGRRIRARRAVVADTSAQALYERLLDPDCVPDGLRRRMQRFTWDLPTLKLNLRLDAPMPWTASAARGAGVVHVGQDLPGLVRWSADLESDVVPERPFSLVGQMTTIDPSRSPAGTEALWLYTHLPRGRHDDPAAAREVVAGVEDMLESLAPGWSAHEVGRWVQTPRDLQAADANLGHGAVGGGTQQLFQQAIWRPTTGLGGPRTHVAGLYLGSAATHPGGGVHGGCGFLAARAALQDSRWWGRPRQRLLLSTLQRLHDAR